MRTMAYVLRRLGHGVIVLWAAYTLTFLILSALPGDPIQILLGAAGASAATPEQIDAIRAQYGLDRPLWAQYLESMAGLFRGDLGLSYASGQPVAQAIGQVLPSTLQLAGATLVLAVTGGIALAVLAAGAKRPWLRSGLAGLPGLGVSLPTFWVGLILLQLVSFRLGWIPALGAHGLAGVILPALTLALPVGAVIAQVLLQALDAAAAQQFITTYHAAGLRRWTLLLTHALPVAGLSLLSVAGLVTGQLLGGAVVVETVFTRNGLGRLVETSVAGQDIPVVQGIVLVAAAVFVVVNLVTDLLYPVFDARTRPTPAGRRTARSGLRNGRSGAQTTPEYPAAHPTQEVTPV
ncbi:ABC transporter permease [Brevibacterium sp. 91QC2O2]|uniref:ABC transporter permease n=1 Tax=Brevibacterium TaxID=1696 RepID=UPI00211CC04F|nr:MULTISPECIES: ABC transporter permease [unclassified Brevibacterium]MCQ9367827.1 ABC transporter permease [Brevibacterium sp. 91QC2O2]MCQ9384868.1 ABC transporter permease [Brevibacterium sp. 68QC2CO]